MNFGKCLFNQLPATHKDSFFHVWEGSAMLKFSADSENTFALKGASTVKSDCSHKSLNPVFVPSFRQEPRNDLT